MAKKIIGVLFWATALIVIIGAAAGGFLMSDRAPGIIIPALSYILAGLFFFRFDRALKRDFADGFAIRKQQNLCIILFVVFYALLIFLVGVKAGMSAATNPLGSFILGVVPYFIPALVFSGMFGMYAAPFNLCKKQFGEASFSAEFESFDEKDRVLASETALFFPRYFCLIPFEKIESVKFVSSLERDIIFTLKNKKKLEIVAGKKQYEAVLAAMDKFAR